MVAVWRRARLGLSDPHTSFPGCGKQRELGIHGGCLEEGTTRAVRSPHFLSWLWETERVRYTWRLSGGGHDQGCQIPTLLPPTVGNRDLGIHGGCLEEGPTWAVRSPHFLSWLWETGRVRYTWWLSGGGEGCQAQRFRYTWWLSGGGPEGCQIPTLPLLAVGNRES